jgi:signal transduction histidine kinase
MSGLENRVLIHASAGKDALLAARVLATADVESLICTSMHEVLSAIDQGAGALVVMEETLTTGALKLLGDYVAHQPHWSDIPILVITHQGADSPGLQSVMQTLNNLTLLERPVRTRALVSTVQSALAARRRQYQVREAEQRKDEFLASLAHELRNPLAPIRTSMSVLSMMYPAASGVTRICEVVERQISHLTRLVDDLLDVARITSGKIRLQRQQVALSTVVAHAMEICAPLLKEGQHAVAVTQPKHDVTLDADPVRLVQSLANIIGNAIKFTPPPGNITVTAEVEGNYLRLSVRDNGIGMEPEALTRIFDMFAQSGPMPDSGRGSGGLGIGLSLAKRFVEMHGGSIGASSAGRNGGSEFVMTLPVVIDAAPARKTSDVVEAAQLKAGNRRVLVVDDNRDAADMLLSLFEASGFTSEAVYDGQAAVEAAGRFKPHVIVMDIGMPRMDGYEAIRRIRALPDASDILAIALTGWGQDSAVRQAEEAGFNHHVVKPVNFSMLKKLLA